jgi:hypothetical protein
MENNFLMIKGMLTLRDWCKSNLPIEDSLVAYDIVLIIAISHYTKSPLSVKNLFSSMPHSYTATRYHYSRFISEGWLEHEGNEKDKRIKFVKATDKFIGAIDDYVAMATKIFSPPELI